MSQPFTPEELRDLAAGARILAKDWDARASVASPITRGLFEEQAVSFRELAGKCEKLANETHEVSA
jgi:hypothetical protein